LAKNDEAMHTGLMKLLDEGTFELKAREVPAFIQVYNWTKALDFSEKEEVKEEKKEEKPNKKATKKK
jgi:hypothetical protein